VSFPTNGYGLAPDDGDALWFFNTLATVKAGGEETSGSFTFVEFLLPPAFGPPPHIHHKEDEAWYVLEGEVTFTCGDKTLKATPGSFVLAPRDIPHSFMTWADGPARFLQVTGPSQFENFAKEMGSPASELRIPDPGPIDMEKLMAVSQRYDVEWLPPPGPPQ
jgi:mannose-6-phosphate isomerase-like protein (cupin superfamily)